MRGLGVFASVMCNCHDMPIPSLILCFPSLVPAGLRGLYAGVTPTILRAAPGNAAVFAAYEWLLHSVLNK